jgi:hypothetical protein
MIERAQGYGEPCECGSIKEEILTHAREMDEAELYDALDCVECDYCREERRLEDAYWTEVDAKIDEGRGK